MLHIFGATEYGSRTVTVQAITVTEAAAARIRNLLSQDGKGAIGIRVGVRNAGCSGMTYTLEFASEKNADDTVVEHQGVTVVIDPSAVIYLVGAEMDYEESKLRSGFVFNNPNEKGRCGCGESFHV